MKTRFFLMFSLTLLLSTICAVVVAKEVIQKDIGQGVAVSNTRAHRFNQQNQLQSPTNNQLQYYNTDNQSVRNNIDDRSVWDDSDNQSIWDDSDNHSIWDNSDIYWNSNNSLLIDQLQNKLWNHKNNDSDQPWNRESNNNNRHSKWNNNNNNNNRLSSSPNWNRNWHSNRWNNKRRNPSGRSSHRSFWNNNYKSGWKHQNKWKSKNNNLNWRSRNDKMKQMWNYLCNDNDHRYHQKYHKQNYRMQPYLYFVGGCCRRTCCDHSDITYNRSYEIYNNEQYNSPNNEEKQTTGVGQGRTTETYTYQAAEPSSSPPLNQTNDATRRQTNAMLRFVDFCTT